VSFRTAFFSIAMTTITVVTAATPASGVIFFIVINIIITSFIFIKFKSFFKSFLDLSNGFFQD
jgi:hypothetical protein